MMPRGRKITLAQAVKQGEAFVTFHCCAPVPGGSRCCNHQGELTIEQAIARAKRGEATRLDELNVRCTICGARRELVDVRCRQRKRAGGMPSGAIIEA